MCPDRRVIALLLVAALGVGCNSGSQPIEGSGDGAASANADRVLVVTLAPEPTRTPEPPTPTQPPAATIALPTPTLVPPTTTHTPQPTQTPPPSPTFTPNTPPSPTPTPTITGTATGSSTLTSREQTIFDAHNAERTSRGIAPLTIDPTLQTIARARAQIMAANNLFSHYAPNGQTIYDLFAAASYAWVDATENIHFNDVSLSQSESWAMTEYMTSPAHRANILKPGYHRLGVGVATSAAGVHYYSVVFSD